MSRNPRTRAGRALLASLHAEAPVFVPIGQDADAIADIEDEAARLTVEKVREAHVPIPQNDDDYDSGSHWQGCSCGWNTPGPRGGMQNVDIEADWWGHILDNLATTAVDEEE